MNKKSKGNISARKTRITKEGNFKSLDGFLLNAVSDAPDLRDFQYEPALIPLQNEIPAPENLEILDQGKKGLVPDLVWLRSSICFLPNAAVSEV